MGGWEGYLRIFFRYFHRITGVLQVLAGARLLPCEGKGNRGGSGVGRARAMWGSLRCHSELCLGLSHLSLEGSKSQAEP